MVLFAVLLVLNPQPRPMTPTFMQNCVLCGLMWGCIVGFRMETDRRLGRGIFGFSEPSTENGLDLNHKGSNSIAWGHMVLRTVVGYTLVMIIRSVLKPFLCAIFHVFGLDPNPAKRVPRKGSDPNSKDKQPELRGWDLWAAAMVKTIVYAALAWSITCACPAFFEAIGLPSEMNG